MSIQSSILSMLSSAGQAIALPKAISKLNKEGAEAPSPVKPKSKGSVKPMVKTKDVAEPLHRVEMERFTMASQKKLLDRAKEEFNKPQDFSKGFVLQGGIK